MSNGYFRFTQFTVWQDKCAMKVCTDACLFGAWTANRIKSTRRMLDIGAGTGLLSLMAAQKSTGPIDAVEIDTVASVQAGENFQRSPWPERLSVINASVQQYADTFKGQYDLIFSNPPFFSKDLKSPDGKRNLAFHSEALSLEELFHAAQKMLAPKGLFSLIVPYHRAPFIEKIGEEEGFYVLEKVNVRQTVRHSYFRTMYLFCRMPEADAAVSEITIKNEHHQYTPEFSEIMKDYYLVPDNALP
jgi:tRNA1Val (adenine37-N6)-methyltransferase